MAKKANTTAPQTILGAGAAEQQEAEQPTTTLPSIDLAKYVVTLEEDGVKVRLSALDIADEAVKVQGIMNQAKRKGGEFASHMFALAALCKTPEEFLHLCEEIAIRKMWGRPPAGTPKAQRMLWGELPATFSVYKSQISKAWQDGIVPNGTLTQSVIENGKVKQLKVKVDGINKLKTLHGELKKERKDKKEKAAAEPGVHLEDGGVSKMKEAAQPEISADIAAKLGAIANLYGKCSESTQALVAQMLQDVIEEMEAEQ